MALDWSVKGIHVTFDGVTVEKMSSTDALLAVLEEPHRLVAESTFESWDPAARARMVVRIRAAGHEIYVYRPRQTARVRDDLGVPKSDSNDATIIYRIAAEGLRHVYRLPDPEPSWVDRRTRLNRDYQMLRLSGGKDDLVRAAKEILDPYRSLDPEAQPALGNPKAGTYSASLLAALYFAAQHCTSREEMERLLGFHGSAYPGLLRSDVFHHSYRHARNRGVDLSTFRRHVRRTFRTLKQALPPPAHLDVAA